MENKLQFLMLASSNKKQKVLKQKAQPLPGIKHDMRNFRNKFKEYADQQLIESSKDQKMLLSRNFIIGWLEKYFNVAAEDIHLFYTGHGHRDGDWAVETSQKPESDRISLKQILSIWNKNKVSQKFSRLFIYMDSCFSGRWCYQLSDLSQKNVSIFASSSPDETSADGNGGLLMSTILGNDSNFEQNYQLLKKRQNPICSINAGRPIVLDKQKLRLLQKSIKNAAKFMQGGQNNNTQVVQNNQGKIQNQGTTQINNQNNNQNNNLNNNMNNNQINNQINNTTIPNTFIANTFIPNPTLNSSFALSSFSTFQTPNFSPFLTPIPGVTKTTYYNVGTNNSRIQIKSSQAPKNQTFMLENGKYQGLLVNGKPQGKGIFYFKNGDKFQGLFKNGIREGKGIYIFATGPRYQGQFKNNKIDGKGTYYEKSGDRYQGQWRDSLKDGKGIYYYKNGQKYDGQFKNDKIEGKGTYTHNSGNRYQGQFKNFQREGKGTLYIKNGDKIVGQWINGKLQGKATYYYANGKFQNKQYKNNQVVK